MKLIRCDDFAQTKVGPNSRQCHVENSGIYHINHGYTEGYTLDLFDLNFTHKT